MKLRNRLAMSQPAFVLVVGVLLVAAITFNTATQRLRLHFKKEAVAQPRDFHELPSLMGNWLQTSEDEKLDKEMQDVLGTEKYVYRDYIDVDRCGADMLVCLLQTEDAGGGSSAMKTLSQRKIEVRSEFDGKSFDDRVKMLQDALKDKTQSQRKQALFAVQSMHPDAVVNVGLTYYTGLVDTVAHIPDRCYIADGYEPSQYEVPTWNLGKDSTGKDQSLEVRFISFEDQTGSHRVPKCVAYVFNVNGHYESDPLGVRRSLQSLTQRYGYYAKIELMTLGNDPQVSTGAMVGFLSSAKSQIETCFPDWAKVNQSSR